MEKMISDFVETGTGDANTIFAQNPCSMIEIDDTDYDALTAIFGKALEGRSYFNGSISCDREGFTATLKTTVLVYRTEEEYPEGTRERMTKVVPVWWELSTWLSDGTSVINDFTFRELEQRLVGGI